MLSVDSLSTNAVGVLLIIKKAQFLCAKTAKRRMTLNKVDGSNA